MANEVATTSTGNITMFSAEDVNLIKDTICKGANETEFKLFMYQANKTQLNPLARQIFAVKRWDGTLRREVMSIQTSIDGFRLIAERTGQYAGQAGPFWCGDDGVWKDVWTSDSPPAAAKVGALRGDFKEPCWGVARFNAYAQKKKEGGLTHMWAKMPDVMIAKCAEALALRKAFPQELSGLYTSDEMEQAAPLESERAEPQEVLSPEKKRGKKEDSVQGDVDFAKEYAAAIGLTKNEAELEALVKNNAQKFSALFVSLPKWHERLCQLLDEQRDLFANPRKEVN